MARNTGPGKDGSDRALDKEAFGEEPSSEQHDEADKNQEKNRLARDIQRHHHDVDEQQGDSGSAHGAKHKG